MSAVYAITAAHIALLRYTKHQMMNFILCILKIFRFIEPIFGRFIRYWLHCICSDCRLQLFVIVH